MGINIQHLKEYVIRPTLSKLGLDSKSAVNLLAGTAAHESRGGYFLKQIKGIALGIYQIEPATHKDVWDNYLIFRNELAEKVKALASQINNEELITNLAYATAIARIIYLRAPEELPGHDDVYAIGSYWKKYYNTELGKGKIQEFIRNYNNHECED